ncbi:uncharacterized protein LOC128723855 [Anopheles nili]|uniref:uncharacterized protein LOC128723855 n=1 Tax=Anopheles nili TaxID=185578 RepID=UPI00237AC4E5|nr:uncharacterized protein LOC128723855 [Anopheles nili]
MASRVPVAGEMSPTVHAEAAIEPTVTGTSVHSVAQASEAVSASDRKDLARLGSPQDDSPNATGNGRDHGSDGGDGSNNSNNNSSSMKCLNFAISPSSGAHDSHGCEDPTRTRSTTTTTTATSTLEDAPVHSLDSAKSNQFVNHSFSCCREMGTSGSVAAGDETGKELTRGFADVVRVSTSVPQPVIIRTEPETIDDGATGTSFRSATAAAVAAVAMTAAAAAAAAVSPSSRVSRCNPASGDGSQLTDEDTITNPTFATNPDGAATPRVSCEPPGSSIDHHHHHQPCDINHQHHHYHHYHLHHNPAPGAVMPSVSTNVPLDATNVPSSASNQYHPIVTTTATSTVSGRPPSKPPLHSYQQHYHSYHHHGQQQQQQQPQQQPTVEAVRGVIPVLPSGGGTVPMVAGGGTYRAHSARFMTRHIKILPKTQSLDLADNDDMLEASNRSESQLEISAAGIVPPGLRGRVLPKLQTLDQTTRPIYPNVPYSPYNSPYGSPRSGRRRTPLRESRRVSIEQSGSFLQLNQYKLLDQIGQGSYGLVKLAYSEEDSTHYAMKILSKRKLLRKAGLMRRGPKRGTSPLDRVYREIAVLKKLDHPNVVKLVEVLDDPLEDSLYLVFELVQQGEVLSIPTDTPLGEERAWNVFRDVLLGVEYLHYQRIIHGDLKPANLLLSDVGSVKVADLGVCNEFLGEDAAMNNGSTAGTPAFRAPETLLPGQHFYNGKAADIWALGATLFSLVHGNVPFIATSVPGVYEKIKNDPLEYPATSDISEELRDLIGRMLDKDPQQRITLPQIKEHPWLTRHGSVRLPTEEENCRLPVQINDEDMCSVVKSIPKLDTLILIKTMLKKHSFQNPFTKGISGRAPQAGGSRLERFCRSGRSNSAPGDYHTSERQPSNESLLPSVTEGVTSPLGSPPDHTGTGSILSEMDSLTLRSDQSNPSSSIDTDTTTTVKIITTPPE